MLSENTQRQIDALAQDGERPLVICDVDDVVLEYSQSFAAYIARHGFLVDRRRAAVTGNICREDTGEAISLAEVKRLRRQFYRENNGHLETIVGAAQWLNDIARHADIVLLTNLPDDLADERRRNLKDRGIDYPLVTNSGPKGPVVEALAKKRRQPIFFIDNRAVCMTSAFEHVPDAHLIHFVPAANSTWPTAALPFVALTSETWLETGRYILELLSAF